jgi:hypothetical protein
MKITKQQLRQIIKEELKKAHSSTKIIKEGAWLPNDLKGQSALVDEVFKKLAHPSLAFAFAVAIIEKSGATVAATEVNTVLQRAH